MALNLFYRFDVHERIFVSDHKLDSYIYERVGSCRYENEWLDFGYDFLQHAFGKTGLDSDPDDADESYDDLYVHDDDFDDYTSSSDHDEYGGYDAWLNDDQLDEDKCTFLVLRTLAFVRNAQLQIYSFLSRYFIIAPLFEAVIDEAQLLNRNVNQSH